MLASSRAIRSDQLIPRRAPSGSVAPACHLRTHYTCLVPGETSYASYPCTAPALAWLALQHGPRSFRADAQRLIGRLSPPLRVEGEVPDVRSGSWLIVVNHYSRPGFRAWWFPMAISTTLPREICWLTTSALTFPDRLRASTLTPASAWFLRHAAKLYGFIPMPPMPPRSFEVEARAEAVRRALQRAGEPQALMGMAPEGADQPGGVLSQPPPGSGRFLQHLARRGLHMLPVGAFEANGRLCLRFGLPFDLPAQLPNPIDQSASQLVMSAIAAVLPRHLRGSYA